MQKQLRDFVCRRAHFRCEYCQLPQEFEEAAFEVDHIIALKHRGSTRHDNLALACFHCNNHKGPNIAGIDVETGSAVVLFHPRRDDWREHFFWHGATLVGRTAAGRVTIEVLEINLPHRLYHRQALIEEGIFPP
jgi:hypothetical protein